MASVYSKSGKWYLRYKTPAARWVDRVTSLSGMVVHILEEWLTDLGYLKPARRRK